MSLSNLFQSKETNSYSNAQQDMLCKLELDEVIDFLFPLFLSTADDTKLLLSKSLLWMIDLQHVRGGASWSRLLEFNRKDQWPVGKSVTRALSRQLLMTQNGKVR